MKPLPLNLSCLAALALGWGCASGQKAAGHTAAVENHVYAEPLEDVLSEATKLLSRKGWHVERAGDTLGTNWRLDAGGNALGYRVEGIRIDSQHSSIRIESLAASSFAPNPSGAKGFASDPSSGSRGSAWEGVDAPTTLGDPPPGMVTLPRGRDEALEWALLQVLEPRDAEAIQRADTRALAAAPPDAGAQPSGCAPPELTGVAGFIAERRVVLLADVPGTNEIPDFVGRLACQAARTGASTVVALELLRADQDWVDTYFASQGTPQDRLAFLQVTRSFDSRVSGARGSDAVLQLLDRLRALRDAGLAIRVVAFDEAPQVPSREQARATTLERIRRTEPDTLLLVLAERSHVRTQLAPKETEEQAPLGWFLTHWGLHPLALDVRSPGGQTWSCSSSRCGVAPAAANTGPPQAPGAAQRSVTLYATPEAQPFQGEYSIGPLTPSSAPTP